VDEMEVWQAAAILGVDEKPAIDLDDDRYVGTFAGRPITEADQRRLEKFASHSGEQVDLTSQVMSEMGIRTG
jgi:hypothetical protein